MKVILDDMPVRFTPDGKLYVLDAIAALSGIDPAEEVWESLVKENPAIEDYADDHCPADETPLPVTDSDGWEQIQDYLFDHLTRIHSS